jgi:hypothetical protein
MITKQHERDKVTGLLFPEVTRLACLRSMTEHIPAAKKPSPKLEPEKGSLGSFRKHCFDWYLAQEKESDFLRLEKTKPGLSLFRLHECTV